MKKLTKKEKVLLGVSVVSVGVAGYLGYKYLGKDKISEKLKFLEFLVIESGCIPKAKQNGTNKLAREESKIKGIIDAIAKRPNDETLLLSLKKHEAEAKAIRYQLENIYKLEELINNDEIIYAK